VEAKAQHVTASTDRIVILDSLRMLAVVGVVLMHGYNNPMQHHYVNGGMSWLGNFLEFGKAIRIPFMLWLSGYVLMLVLPKYIERSGGIVPFLIRRAIRLTPTWWLAIAFLLLIENVYALQHRAKWFFPPIRQLLSNLFFAPNLTGDDVLIGPAYFLMVDVRLCLQLSALVLCALVIKRTKWLEVLQILMVASLGLTMLRHPYVEQNLLGGYWSWFAFGTVCHLQRLIPQRWPGLLIALLAMIANNHNGVAAFGISVADVVLILLTILCTQTKSSFVWSLGLKWPNLATTSYVLFLIHAPIQIHAFTFEKLFLTRGWHPATIYITVCTLPLLLAIAITPLMNRIDKFLMAKLFPPVKKQA
jgi:peptidoglycan/LPS O-acetylase OafA/YrhL